MMRVYVQRLDRMALPPEQRSGDVGFDIRTLHEHIIGPGAVKVIGTGFAFAVEHELASGLNVFAKIEGRSSLAQMGLFPIGGIIDPDYRGEVKAILYNSSKVPLQIHPGDKIAQLVFYAAMISNQGVDGIQILSVDNLDDTLRGTDGFGSTGR